MVTRKGRANGTKTVVQPKINLADKGRCIRVTAELPGAREETIQIDIERSILILSARGEGMRYKKEISLPAEVRYSTKRFRNGILDLYLEKTGPQ
jgi:HSP20 family molecular chaperone IbpA